MFIDFHVNQSLATNGNERFVWVRPDKLQSLSYPFLFAGQEMQCPPDFPKKEGPLCYADPYNCPDATFTAVGKSCYRLFWGLTEIRNWPSASAHCMSFSGARLAKVDEINRDDVASFISGYAPLSEHDMYQEVWIGLTQQSGSTEIYVWDRDGTTVNKADLPWFGGKTICSIFFIGRVLGVVYIVSSKRLLINNLSFPLKRIGWFFKQA